MDGFAHLIIIGLGALVGYSVAKERPKKVLREGMDDILDYFHDSDKSSAADIEDKVPLKIPNKSESSTRPQK